MRGCVTASSIWLFCVLQQAMGYHNNDKNRPRFTNYGLQNLTVDKLNYKAIHFDENSSFYGNCFVRLFCFDDCSYFDCMEFDLKSLHHFHLRYLSLNWIFVNFLNSFYKIFKGFFPVFLFKILSM